MNTTRYSAYDEPELNLLIMSKFTPHPERFKTVYSTFSRFLWNSAGFNVAVSIDNLDIEEFKTYKNFVYDKTTEMFFLNFTSFPHQLFMAYMGALNKFDFSNIENDDSFPDLFNVFNAFSKLSDDYITKGQGILLSSVSKNILLSEDFQMSDKEQMFFNHFEKHYIT